jgi:hypothetical protein
MPTATKSQKAIRRLFKSIFKLGSEKEGGGLRKGSEFNPSFLKDLAKDQKGLDEIKNLYDELTTDPKVQPIIRGKTLSEALSYNSRLQTQFVDNLENWVKKGDIETRDIFLKRSLGITPQEINENFPEVAPPKSSSSESSSSEEEEEDKAVVKPEEKTKVKKEVEKIEGKVSSGKMKMSKEAFDRVQKEKQELASKMGAGASGMEPPTFSPDEMRSTKEDMSEERKAQADARASRPTSGMTTEEEAELLDITQPTTDRLSMQPPSENVKMDMKKPDMRSEIDDLQPLPSKADFIPPMRLGTRGKDIKDLLEDIAYFMKNFKGQLTRETEIFKEVDKTNIEQLRKLHGRIVGKLAPKQKNEGDKKIGIIVNADDYIREQMKKILQEQTFSSLRPQDVVIDVGSKTSEGRDNKDFGDFAVKRTIDGGLASTREAVYRYMPSENDDQVGEEGKTEKQRRKPNRLELPKARLNNQRTTAIRMNVQNPFRVPQKTMKLKYLY